MAKKSKEIQDMHARRWQIVYEVRDLSKEIESANKYKSLIKICKEFATITKNLQDLGEKVDIGPKKYSVQYWEDLYKKFSANQREIAKAKEAKNSIDTIKKKTSNKISTSNEVNLYYINLAWTVKPNYYVCNSIIDKVKNYLEKMKLTYTFTFMDEFPDRIEYSHEYKIKCTEDVYNTIISSAEYILEISTDSAYESCNIGVFGRKIE